MAFIRSTSGSGGSGGSGDLPPLTIVGSVTNPGNTIYNFTDNYAHILVVYAQMTASFGSVVYPEGSILKQELINTDGRMRLYEFENVSNGTSINFTSTGWGTLVVYTF